jgi:hypothetical protein
MSLLTTNLQASLASSDLLTTTAVGAVTFPTVLALTQTAIFKPLRITCASRLAPIFGGLSVSLAGFTASFAAIKAYSLIQDSLKGETRDNFSTGKPLSFSAPELVISTVSSVVIFRALGGRFSSVLPSHLFHPGAFAVERVPAVRGQQAAVSTEKALIREYGRKYGCHTCGKKRVDLMVCDHQPPSYFIRKNNSSSAIASSERNAGEAKLDLPSSSSASSNGNSENGAKVKQFFYPQCYSCSSMQGGLLNGGARSKLIVTHPFSLRLYHIFLPVPFAIAYLKSTLQDEISTSSLAKLARTSSTNAALKTFSSKTTEVVQEKVEKSTQTSKGSVAVASSNKNSLRSFIQESDIPELVSNFPLLILWKRAVQFFDSFKNPGDGFHIMLWAFVIVAAWGTV